MNIIFSILGLFLCVWLSSAQAEAQNEEKYTGNNLRKITRLSLKQYERPRKPRDFYHQRQLELCTRTGDYCVPREACIFGFIDKAAAALIHPFAKQSRCGINEVCCQTSEQVSKCGRNGDKLSLNIKFN